jgi:hypothetical protein
MREHWESSMRDDGASFGIPNTPPNAALAATVRERLKAEAARIKATNAFWWLSGLGVWMLLGGIGVGAVLCGYSYVTDQRAAAGNLADALVTALHQTTITTAGVAKLAEDGKTVKLDTSDPLRLDTTGATVHLDTTDASIRPTEQQLRSQAVPQSGAKPVTDFIVFKTVEWGKGSVITGWEYGGNEDETPKSQFCYYNTPVDPGNGIFMRYDIANDGVLDNRASKYPFDAQKAFSHCIWFGRAPHPTVVR